MSNTTTMNGPIITITGLDADWLWNSDTVFTNGIKVHSIRFHPSGANDIMIIHDHGIDGAEIFSVKCSGDTDDRVQYYNGAWLRPVIDITDCTLSSAAAAKVTIHVV